MLKIKFFAFALLFGAQIKANPLFILEKQRYENEIQKSALIDDIELTKKKIELGQAAIGEKKQQLVKYLRADQQLEKFEFGGLMAVENMGQLKRNLAIFEKIKAQNLNLLRELKYTVAELENERLALVYKAQQLDKINDHILAQEKRLKQVESETLQKLTSTNENSLLKSKGHLSSPLIDAKLKINFGAYLDEKKYYTVFNKGQTFWSTPGQVVQAVGPGKVIFSDQIKYWGESMIVEHAGDYYSVYTNLKNRAVQVGQNILQSEKIGEAMGSEFYFELRNQTIAINPKNWTRN
jgi:septal ring factor EnvC (AmiA/AmiB activator)